MITAGELAERLGAEIEGDSARTITAIHPPETAGPDHLAYLADDRRTPTTLEAGVLLVGTERTAEGFPEGATILRHPLPRLGFARAIGILHPPPAPPFEGIDPDARIDGSAEIGEGTSVAAHAFIGPGVVLGRSVRIDPGVIIVARCQVEDGVHLHPNVVLYPETRIGPGSMIHAGAVIGCDGFGFVPTPDGAAKIPHIGGVRIGAQVEIGANTTIDRGVLGDTVIHDGTKIDNLCQIAHNTEIGPAAIIAAQVGVAGTSKIGAGSMLGGQAGVADHVEIGSRVRVAGRSGVIADVEDGAELMGFPAIDARVARRAHVLLYQLPELRRHIERLAARLETLLPPEDREDGED